MRPLLTFVAIFKDEAATVRKTLASVKPWIDRWYVLDTGSSDGTLDIVVKEMSPTPGWTKVEPFVDYATTRNRAIELATDRYTDEDISLFTLMLSADEVLEGGAALREFLEAHRHAPDGAYCIQMQTGPRTWPYTRVLRTSAGWKYVGERHERPVGPNGEVSGPIVPSVRIIHTESDPIRKIRRIRDQDLPRLTEAVNDDSKSLDERAHDIFFLAETHAILGAECQKGEDGKPVTGGPWLSHMMASMGFYFRYAQIAENAARTSHDHDKAMYSYFLYYHIADKAGFYTSEELVSRLSVLVQAAPKLAEARFMLAQHAAMIDIRQGLMLAVEAADVAREAAQNPTHEATDTRLEWLSLRIAAQCAKQLEKHSQARDLARRAVSSGGPKEAFAEIL